MLSCEHEVNRLFCSSHFSCTTTWMVFSIFSFYDCGINVQIETSFSDVLLALSWGIQMWTWYQPLPHRRPTHARIYTCFLSRVDVAQNMLRKLRAQASQSSVEMASSERHSRKSHNTERCLKNSALATLI